MPGQYAALQTHWLFVSFNILLYSLLPIRPALWGAHTNSSNPLTVLTKHSGILVAIFVVFKCNLGVMKEGSSKNEGMLALIKDEQRLMIDYPSNVNFNIFTGSIKHPGIA
jgi:hypothetical protein